MYLKTKDLKSTTSITGIIVAGGQSSRFNYVDKAFLKFENRPMIEHIIARLEPQVDSLIINSNQNKYRFKRYAVPIVSDKIGTFFGPLSGIYSAMTHCSTPFVLTVPCDSPRFPSDLSSRMLESIDPTKNQLCVAHDGIRLQPLFALISLKLCKQILAYLKAGHRKVTPWILNQDPIIVDFSDKANCFVNINTPEDQQQLLSNLTAISC